MTNYSISKEKWFFIKRSITMLCCVLIISLAFTGCTTDGYALDIGLDEDAETQILKFAQENERLLIKISDRIISKDIAVFYKYSCTVDITKTDEDGNTPALIQTITQGTYTDGVWKYEECNDSTMKKLEKLMFVGMVIYNREADGQSVIFEFLNVPFAESGYQIIYVKDGNVDRVMGQYHDADISLIKKISKNLFVIDING